MKNETLEDAAERLYQYQSQNPPYTIITPKAKVEGFIEGAKWQAERMYSEEDLKEAFRSNYTPFSATNTGDFDEDFDRWFEQFKKK
jgi:hypothetical protein